MKKNLAKKQEVCYNSLNRDGLSEVCYNFLNRYCLSVAVAVVVDFAVKLTTATVFLFFIFDFASNLIYFST
ncbi:MAG: hypothetical protein IJU14_07080 [Clostridia bacterium]|nr:hypothetical protein [Clostridia bacterium]